jgi:ubiquinone/menaquinone biosynthesis C-methylase UbiE
MILNWVERALMNNPLRTGLQRHLEAKVLLELGGPVHGAALEVGCGKGAGCELVLDVFAADRVDAIDLDPRMVALAQRRLGDRGDHVRIEQGSATRLAAPDSAYDAVFDFAILHHIPDWRGAIVELFRVLKPGGRAYLEEVLAAFIVHPVWRALLDHPQADRFDAAQFSSALEDAGFVNIRQRTVGSWFGWFVAEKPG